MAQILAAATYPNQVVQADRWMQQNSYLDETQRAQKVEPQPWDPSVKALTEVPSVLGNMDKNMSWTLALGEAYVARPQDVMDAIQVMRQRAEQAGNLASNPQQTVTDDGNTIAIEPSDPDIVYVPQYDPWLAYGAPIGVWPGWYGYPGLFWDGPGIGFGLGFRTGFGFHNGFHGGYHHSGAYHSGGYHHGGGYHGGGYHGGGYHGGGGSHGGGGFHGGGGPTAAAPTVAAGPTAAAVPRRRRSQVVRLCYDVAQRLLLVALCGGSGGLGSVGNPSPPGSPQSANRSLSSAGALHVASKSVDEGSRGRRHCDLCGAVDDVVRSDRGAIGPRVCLAIGPQHTAR